jgi:hypothetical protein
MSLVNELEQQRERVLGQMQEIRSMKRGTINTQYFKVLRHGKKTKKLREPYYVFSRKEGKKTVSQRLHSKAEGAASPERYRRLSALC